MHQVGTTITERDFETAREQLEFVNNCLPVPLPRGATVRSIEYDSWLDWNLKAVVKVPKDVGYKYVESLRSPGEFEQPKDITSAIYTFTNTGEIRGNVNFDDINELLTIDCTNSKCGA